MSLDIDKSVLDRKSKAASALALSMACLKLELPEQVWNDHHEIVVEYLQAEGAVAGELHKMLAEVQRRVEALGR